MKSKIIPRWIVLHTPIFLALILGIYLDVGVHAQNRVGTWSEPIRLSQSEEPSWYDATTGRLGRTPTKGFDDLPVIGVDSGGNIHVLWTHQSELSSSGWGDTIYYTRWDGASWSTPIDILVGPGGGSAQYLSLAITTDGTLHLVWVTDSRIYYSRAYALEADSPWAWSPPKNLASSVGVGNFSASLTADASDILHLVYADASTGTASVYYRSSSDNGLTWSNSVHVSYHEGPEAVTISNPLVAVDQKGSLHVVWDQYQLPQGWPPTGVFYSKSVDKGKTWSSPLPLALGAFGWPAILVDGDVVHVVWNGTSADIGKYYRWSNDGGLTWSDMKRITEDLGGLTSGRPDLVVDSEGSIHLLMVASSGQRTPKYDQIWYSYWNGNHWSDPQPISKGMYGEFSRVAVGNGNQLHVVWSDKQDIWYATYRTGAPFVPSNTLPTVTSMPTSIPVSIEAVTVTPTPALKARDFSGDNRLPLSDPSSPILWGIIPVFFIVSIVLLGRIIKLRQNR